MSVQETNLKAIADAIREKEGSTESIPASEFPARILALETDGAPEGTYMIALESSGPEGGAVSGGGLASEGMTVTVRADAVEGYKFAGWQEDGETVSEDAEYIFTVTGDRELTGMFETAASRLPEGYSEVEYILFPDNFSRVGLSYYAYQKNITRVILDFTETDINSGVVFCGYTDPEGEYFSILFNKSTINYAPTSAGTWGETSYSIEADKRLVVDFDLKNKMIVIDGQTLPIGDVKPGIALSSMNVGSNGRFTGAKMELYSFKMYDENDLVVDFVPCVNESGAAGLYDLVGNTFFSGTNISAAQ